MFEETEEMLEDATQWARENMPEEIKTLISLANSDLYSGPIYLDEEGEECSMFDEGAKAFDFQKACAKISDWINANIEDVKIEMMDLDEDGEEITWTERLEDSARQIIRTLLGRELASHV